MPRPLFTSARRLLRTEAAGGLVLVGAAIVALLLANSPYDRFYGHLWSSAFATRIGRLALTTSPRAFINDGLMVAFFFVAGRDIRRETTSGALSGARYAALPIVAALGGVLTPAAIYLALNAGLPTRVGWGVPTATDIAFAVGVLGLLGGRVPAPVRALLLSLAIIDDVAAVAIVALFYSPAIAWGSVLLACLGVVAILALRRARVTRSAAYVLPALAVWLGLLLAGIHPALAGVVLGLTMPASRLDPLLVPFVAYVVAPLFALANAGVDVRTVGLASAADARLFWGVLLGLLIGKPLGILVASALAVRLRLAVFPVGLTWRGLAVAGCSAGVGFTMSLFIAGLSFPESPRLAVARLALIVASGLAALGGLVVGWLVLPAAVSREAF